MKQLLFVVTILFCCLFSRGQLTPFKDAAGKYGFKNSSGQVKISPVYDVAFLYFQDGRLCVNKGFTNKVEKNTEIIVTPGKWGFIDETGKEIIPLQFERAGGFIDGLAKVMLKGKWGFIDPQGKFVVQPIYTFIENFKEGLAIFNTGAVIKKKYSFYDSDYQGGKWGVVDRTGKTIIPAIYDKIWMLAEQGHFTVCKNAKCGALALDGSLLVPVQYDQLLTRSKDLFLAKQNNKFGAVNKKNEVVVAFEYDSLPVQDFTAAFFSFTKAGKQFDFDLAGKPKIKVKSPEPFESAFQRSLAAAADSRERAAAINTYMDQLHTTRLTEEEKIFLLGEKFKQVVDIDYYGVFESVIRHKKENNNPLIYTKACQALSKEQTGFIKVAAQYRIDEFVAEQNNKPKPAWPNGLPLPGYGWGKTTSSNKPGYVGSTKPAVPVVTTPVQPMITEAEVQSAVGQFYEGWTKMYKSNFIMKVLRYKKKSYGEGYDLDVKTTSLYNSCNVNYKTIDAAGLFYIINDTYYKSYDPYETCPSCGGSGYVSQSFSHTNDYRYTLGSKTTYTSTSTVRCTGCKYRTMKKPASCIEYGN